jgi:hypothetical protein
MTTYTDVFGGANIYPSELTYSSLALSANVTLSWPEETSTSNNLAAKIMDVTPASAGLSLTLPAADKTGTGQTILFNNLGAHTLTVRNATGTQVLTIASGTLWQVYLTDNSSAAGSWRSLQYGASISQVNASSLAGTGIVAVGTLLSQSMPISNFNIDYTAGVNDRAFMFVWGGSSGTFTLPAAPSLGNNWFCYLKNAGTGAITVAPSGTSLIDGGVTLGFQPGESAIIATDGFNFYTIGFGQSAVFAFDYTVVNVPGSGNYTLSGTELNRIAYKFTGALTGNRVIIVPATVQQYWINNQTTGAYSLTVKTASVAGITVNQGSRGIYYCDGTSIVAAQTGGLAVPIAIGDGGTGATSASAARTNLGATSVGDALFTATDQAAAWAALGVAQAGVVNGGVF